MKCTSVYDHSITTCGGVSAPMCRDCKKYEIDIFADRVQELELAISDVLSQDGDDVCWMDIYTTLGKLVGIKFDPKMLPRDKMLDNCARFVDSILTDTEYKPKHE